MKIFQTDTTKTNQKAFLVIISIECNLKTESSYTWLKAKNIALSVLIVYLIFLFMQIFPKVFFY